MFPGSCLLAYFSGRAAFGLILIFLAILIYSVISVIATGVWNEICTTFGVLFNCH